ncbi:phosphoglycerate kinase, cytosolic-like [Miscanthus floridulus]|uniref:phosphoglycerate kinase, cytosolic-like n=1 Tax=Miscanthus floridulus TaxID=154761 RepID=UPI00345A29C3
MMVEFQKNPSPTANAIKKFQHLPVASSNQSCSCSSHRTSDPNQSAPKNVTSFFPGFRGGMATKRSVGTLTEADLKGKKVFLRADLNVPLDDSQKITDDTRIRASVPTIKFLMEKGAKVILASHLGRLKGVTTKYSLKPLVPRLSELLGVNVVMANDCIGYGQDLASPEL